MSPLITVDIAGHPFRMPLVVAHNLGIEPGDTVSPDRFPEIERSSRAYATVTHILDRACQALFPDPCGPAVFSPDPHCPECEGRGRVTYTTQPNPLKPPAAITTNCRTCIQPYPRKPRPLAGNV